MRSDIFIKWFYYLDYYFHTIDQKILLFIDNAGSYFNLKQFKESNEKKSEENLDNK